MPRIDFSFQGWIRGADVTHCIDPKTGERVDVSSYTALELAQKLQKGDLTVALGDYLYDDRREAEIEIFDYDDSP